MEKKIIHHDLIAAIEEYCAAASISKAEFGRCAMKDPRFAYDLIKGREVRRSTEARVYSWIKENSARLAAE
jgi:hypothetical protein